jgi:hypothetical protein
MGQYRGTSHHNHIFNDRALLVCSRKRISSRGASPVSQNDRLIAKQRGNNLLPCLEDTKYAKHAIYDLLTRLTRVEARLIG